MGCHVGNSRLRQKEFVNIIYLDGYGARCHCVSCQKDHPLLPCVHKGSSGDWKPLQPGRRPSGVSLRAFYLSSELVLWGSDLTQILTCWGINHLKRAFVSISVTPRKGDSAPSTAWQPAPLRWSAHTYFMGRLGLKEESLWFLSLICCVSFPGGILHFSLALEFSNTSDQGLVKICQSVCVMGMIFTHSQKKKKTLYKMWVCKKVALLHFP